MERGDFVRGGFVLGGYCPGDIVRGDIVLIPRSMYGYFNENVGTRHDRKNMKASCLFGCGWHISYYFAKIPPSDRYQMTNLAFILDADNSYWLKSSYRFLPNRK